MTGNCIFGSIVCHNFILEKNCIVSKETLHDFPRDIYIIAEIEKLFARDHANDLWQQ